MIVVTNGFLTEPVEQIKIGFSSRLINKIIIIEFNRMVRVKAAGLGPINIETLHKISTLNT